MKVNLFDFWVVEMETNPNNSIGSEEVTKVDFSKVYPTSEEEDEETVVEFFIFTDPEAAASWVERWGAENCVCSRVRAGQGSYHFHKQCKGAERVLWGVPIKLPEHQRSYNLAN